MSNKMTAQEAIVKTEVARYMHEGMEYIAVGTCDMSYDDARKIATKHIIGTKWTLHEPEQVDGIWTWKLRAE